MLVANEGSTLSNHSFFRQEGPESQSHSFEPGHWPDRNH